MKMKLTYLRKSEIALYNYIKNNINDYGNFTSTNNEIKEDLKVSIMTIQRGIKNLKEANLIEVDIRRNHLRTITLK